MQCKQGRDGLTGSMYFLSETSLIPIYFPAQLDDEPSAATTTEAA